MRTTIDIPDAIYRELKVRAARTRKTVREIMLNGIAQTLDSRDAPVVRKLDLPLIRSSQPGTLNLTNEQIDDLTAFS